MNPELKAAWIAALRSGSFAQGSAHLERDGEFCCLGVLCKIAGIERRERRGLISYHIPSDTGDEWTDNGVPREICGLTDTDKIHKLVRLNDDECCSFAEIADWIEREI